MDPSNQPAAATALMGASVVWCLLVLSSRRLFCCADGEDSSERGEWIRFPAISYFLKSREILAKFPGKWKMGTHHERWTDDVMWGSGFAMSLAPNLPSHKPKAKRSPPPSPHKIKSTPARHTKRLIHAPPSTNLNKPASLTPPHQLATIV